MEEGRRVGVAIDFSPCSREAVRWAVNNLTHDKNDHLILITIRPEGYYEQGEMQLWETTGSPLIPLSEFADPVIMKKYGVKADAETLDILTTAARQKEIAVVLSCLVIGNRGLGKLKRAIMGSVSNYVVNNASCPVTVVKHHE